MLIFSIVGVDSGTCLLARSRSDPNAFADFYSAYAERVLRFMVRRLLDVEIALDLMSETFAKALQRRRQFRGSTVAEEQAWLFAIASSELSRFWRRGKVERKALSRIGVTVPELADHELERIEERVGVQAIAGALREEMKRLTPDQRKAVELRVLDGMGYEEIAASTEASTQVVRARVSRGLRALAEGLRERGIEAEDFA